MCVLRARAPLASATCVFAGAPRYHASPLLSACAAKADAEGLWRSEAKFHWEQTFPAGRELHVSHAYVPVTGNHLVSREEAATPAYRARYCLDEAGLAGVRRLIAASPMKEQGLTRAIEVPYIVTTARNWAGRIGRFTLTVDKGSPAALVSFCMS